MEECVMNILDKLNLNPNKVQLSGCKKDLLEVLSQEYSEELHSQIEWILNDYKNKLWETLTLNSKKDSSSNIFDVVSDLLKRIKDTDDVKLKSFYRNIIKIVVDEENYGLNEKGNLIDIGKFEEGKHWKFAIIKVGDNYWLINDKWTLVVPPIYKSMKKMLNYDWFYEVTKKSYFGKTKWIVSIWWDEYFWDTAKRFASKLNLYPL